VKEYLDKKIDTWFHERGIIEHGKPMGQAIKTLEETTELIDALNRGDELDIKDAIGDIYVTLRGVCLTSDLFLDECIAIAYDVIKDRKGYLRDDGVFVKEGADD
jgi:hypothetical protein